MGSPLGEVDTLLDLADGGPHGCDQARSIAAGKISDLDQRIADLRRLRGGLARLVATCDRPRGERDCPILHQLDPDPGPADPDVGNGDGC